MFAPRLLKQVRYMDAVKARFKRRFGFVPEWVADRLYNKAYKRG